MMDTAFRQKLTEAFQQLKFKRSALHEAKKLLEGGEETVDFLHTDYEDIVLSGVLEQGPNGGFKLAMLVRREEGSGAQFAYTTAEPLQLTSTTGDVLRANMVAEGLPVEAYTPYFPVTSIDQIVGARISFVN